MNKPKKPTRKIVGSRWRILAHRGVLGTGDPIELRSVVEPGESMFAPGIKRTAWMQEHDDRARADHAKHAVDTPSVFDELCIDDWLHLEQMSARHYWMAIGPLHVNVTIGRDGMARISIQRDGDDRGERVEVYGDVTKARGKK